MAGAGLRLSEYVLGRRAWSVLFLKSGGMNAATRASRKTAGLKPDTARLLCHLVRGGNSRQRKGAVQLMLRCTVQETILRRSEAKDNRKIPWSVLLYGQDAEAFDPPRMLTQCVRPCQRTRPSAGVSEDLDA